MKNICAVVSELLPLYAEEMLSGDARNFVEEHIAGCGKCSAELENIRSQTTFPLSGDESKAYHTAKRRRNMAITVLGIIAASSLAAAVILFALVVGSNPTFVREIPQRMYMGDRITLNVMAKSDGRSVELTEKSVICVFDDVSCQEQKVSFNRISSFNQEFSVSGGEYGVYHFTLFSDGAEIQVSIHNTNWWNVARINLIYDIDTENHTMSYILYDHSDVISAEEDGKTYILGAEV